MLTVDLHRCGMRRGALVLDLGCGTGRHSFEALKRGARVVAVDLDPAPLREVVGMIAAMHVAGEVPPDAGPGCICGDALRLPFADESFDVVVASEVLEHIDDDAAALREIARVLKPGGRAAVTVPRWWPERICWALSSEYRSARGGHVRVYTAGALRAQLRQAGLVPGERHHAHALHAPYWWLKCAVGIGARNPIVDLYHRFLLWDITARPPLVRAAERALDPLLGKSLVIYVRKHLPASENVTSRKERREAVRAG